MRRSTTPRGLPPNTISRCICRNYTPFVHLGVSFGVSGRPCGSPFWAAGGRGPALDQPTGSPRAPAARSRAPWVPCGRRKATLRQRTDLPAPLAFRARAWPGGLGDLGPRECPILRLCPRSAAGSPGGARLRGACLEWAKDPQPVTRELVACAATGGQHHRPVVALRDAAAGEQCRSRQHRQRHQAVVLRRGADHRAARISCALNCLMLGLIV